MSAHLRTVRAAFCRPGFYTQFVGADDPVRPFFVGGAMTMSAHLRTVGARIARPYPEQRRGFDKRTHDVCPYRLCPRFVGANDPVRPEPPTVGGAVLRAPNPNTIIFDKRAADDCGPYEFRPQTLDIRPPNPRLSPNV